MVSDCVRVIEVKGLNCETVIWGAGSGGRRLRGKTIKIVI